ncbi:MAG: hypothetical protein KDA91_12910 [Planctomycetaceae bacterium]|nr:hypothetical protein [Planctomycetaceae bacterium]
MQTATRSTARHSPSLYGSAAGSILVHVLIFVIAGMSLRGCQKTQTGDSGGAKFREVGLFVVDGSDEISPNSGEGTGQALENTPSPAEPVESEMTATPSVMDSPLPEQAPDIRELLGQPDSNSPSESSSNLDLPAVIGAGQPISGVPAELLAGGGLIAPSGAVGQQAVGTGALGPGQTAFMDIADSGSKFVYVIDVSASMSEGNRLQVATSQLKASLRLLQPNQQFQVIFYSEGTHRLRLKPPRDMYFATPVNVMLAGTAVDREQPENGTEHKPALLEALSLEPDVIYFLTDGREPALYPADLRDIKSLAGRTTIHVVEFGSGAISDRSTSWLEILARQSNGQYRLFGTGR